MHLMLIANLVGAHCGEMPEEIVCDGQYPHHLQGIASDGASIFWSFTTVLVKTDLEGTVLARVEGPYHHGDLCYADGKVYVAWSNHFNKPDADSKVYIYDADDLTLLEIKPVPEVTFGAGGMDTHEGRFYIIGGLPEGYEENYVYEYDADFSFVKRHVIPSGYTRLGIQTALVHDDHWWFGCYRVDTTKGLLKTDLSFELVGIYDISPAIGLIGWGEGRFLMAEHIGEKWQAKVVPMVADDELGLAPAP